MEQDFTRNIWAREFGKLSVKVAKAWEYCPPPQSGWPPLSRFLISTVSGGPIRSYHISYPEICKWLRSQYNLHPDEILQLYDPTEFTSEGDRGHWVVLNGETDFLTLVSKIESLMDAVDNIRDPNDIPSYVGLNIMTGLTQRLIPPDTSYIDAETYRQLGGSVSPEVQPPAQAVAEPIETSSGATTPRARGHGDAYYTAEVPVQDGKGLFEPVLVSTDDTTDLTDGMDILTQLPAGGLFPPPQIPSSTSSSRPGSALSGAARTDTTGTDITEPESSSDVPPPVDTVPLPDVRISHDTPEMKAALTALFKLPPGTIFNSKSRVTLHGLKGSVFPYQAEASVWALMRPVDVPGLQGGFIADGTGAGKTVEIFLTCLLAHQLWWRASLVEADRTAASGTRKHLPADASPDAECPVQDDCYQLQCPCVPGGVAEQIAKTLVDGLSLVLVPPHLLGTWAEAAVKFLDLKSTDPYCLRVDVPGVAAANATHTDPPVKIRLSSLQELSRTVRGAVRFESRPTPDSQQGESSKQEKDATKEARESIRPVCRSQVLLIGAWSGIYLNAAEPHYSPGSKRVLPGIHVSVLRWPIVFRSVFFDESHSMPRSLLDDATERGRDPSYPRPAYWFVTATPMSAGPASLRRALAFLEQPGWAEETHPLYRLRSEGVESLHQTYTRLVAMRNQPLDPAAQEDVDKQTLEFQSGSQNAFAPVYIRRMPGEVILGHKIGFAGQTADYQDIHVATGEASRDVITELSPAIFTAIRRTQERLYDEERRQVGPVTAIRHLYSHKNEEVGRLLAAAVLPLLPGAIPEGASIWNLHYGAPAASPGGQETAWVELEARLNDITAGAPKLEALLGIIDQALRDDEPPGSDPTSQPRGRGEILNKIVLVVSSLELVADIIAAWLTKMARGFEVKRISRCRPRGQNREVETLLEEYEGRGEQPRKHTVVVANAQLIGTGRNCGRANYLAMADMPVTRNMADQLRGRIVRYGQLHTPHVFQMIDTSNPLESLLYASYDPAGDASACFQQWVAEAAGEEEDAAIGKGKEIRQ